MGGETLKPSASGDWECRDDAACAARMGDPSVYEAKLARLTTPDFIRASLRALSERERLVVLGDFCRGCDTAPMPCGHPGAAVHSGREGTNHCRWCADLARVTSIKVRLADGDAARRLEPGRIAAYLARRGWRRFLVEEAGAWWEHGKTQRQVGVPCEVEHNATALLVLVQVLAEVEVRSELAVYLDLLNEPEA